MLFKRMVRNGSVDNDGKVFTVSTKVKTLGVALGAKLTFFDHVTHNFQKAK